MLSRLPVRLAMLSCVVLTSFVSAGDWPRFRGPNGSGISDDKNIPVQWTDKDISWKRALPGLGNSSPIVSKDRIFVHASATDASSRMLMCLEAATGNTVWTKTIPAKKAHTHNLNSLASATPAADGERVYVPFWDGEKVELYAYDFSGKFLWKHTLGSFISQHGAGASPVVHDGKVLLLHDQDAEDPRTKKKNPAEKPSVLVCLDAVKGTLLWEKTRPAVRACYSTPFVVEKGGKKEVILTTTPGIVAYDLTTGAELWHYDWNGNKLRTVASTVIDQDMLFVAGGDGSGARHFLALKLADKGNASTAEVVWDDKTPEKMPYVPCVLAHKKHLYSVSDKGFISCFVAKTGKEVWKERLGGRNVSASPLLIDGKIYAIDVVGKVHVIEASPTFKSLGESDAGESVIATPAVADGRLLIRGKSSLICVGKK